MNQNRIVISTRIDGVVSVKEILPSGGFRRKVVVIAPLDADQSNTIYTRALLEAIAMKLGIDFIREE